MLFRILILSACMALLGCGDSSDVTQMNDGTQMITENNEMNDTTSVNGSEDGSVAIDARVRIWTDSSITIDYSLINGGSLELIVFDVGFTATTGLDENGQVRLLKAKRDTGDTDFDQEPTIGGRNLSPDQTINGSANRRLPISIDYAVPRVSDLRPDTIEFCVGYGNADDIIPLTRPDGTYSLNEDLELQTLVCTILNRP